MSKNISEKKEDKLREANFKDVYGISAKIWVTNYNDEKWNWDMCVLNFKDELGKNYGLVEYFKEGEDNGTKTVIFEYESKLGFHKKEFDRFIDAEKEMVKIMKLRKEGRE